MIRTLRLPISPALTLKVFQAFDQDRDRKITEAEFFFALFPAGAGIARGCFTSEGSTLRDSNMSSEAGTRASHIHHERTLSSIDVCGEELAEGDEPGPLVAREHQEHQDQHHSPATVEHLTV